jgi:anionic cell wall polymer biosynthesis LytR-Cps2A-Psr (LCP) family protein
MAQTSRAARGRARRIRRRLMVGCSLLLVLVVVVASGGYGYVHYRFGQIRSVKVPGLRKATSGRPMNLLVVGSDSRATLDDGNVGRYGNVAGQRNDVTLVVRVEPARHRVSLLSIPRDLVSPSPAPAGRTASTRPSPTGPASWSAPSNRTSASPSTTTS